MIKRAAHSSDAVRQWAISLLIVVALAACSSSATVADAIPNAAQRPAATALPLVPQATVRPTDEPTPTQAPTPTDEPTPTEAPVPVAPLPAATPDPTEEPEATPKPLSVKVTKLTKSVNRNGTASITIKTSKGAECSITVQYASGASTAAGLDDKKANSEGLVTWQWKVGGRTTKGSWPIRVWCELGERDGGVETAFKVT